MSVVATQVNGETVQAIGSRARILYAAETSWGTASSTASRGIRFLAGESLDQGQAAYKSKQIRKDRMHNATVRGSQDPGGKIPFELSPNGWNMFLYHLLGGTPVTTGPAGGLINPSTQPTGVPSASGGVLATASYFYVYTGTNATGETLPSPASAVQAVTGPTGSDALTATTITSATGYNFYRGTSSLGPFFYAGTSATVNFTDTGATTGAVAPSSNTTGSVYTHTIKAATTTDMPVGFTLEKGFMDLNSGAGLFHLLRGCRVDMMNLNFKIDAIPEGTFDVVARQYSISSSSQFSNAPVPPIEAPYTSAFIAVYEGSQALPVGVASGNPLGLCTDLSLSVSNAYFKKSGFILGDTLRQNLKPGTRMITCKGKFMFQDHTLYSKAINGTNTSLKIVCTNGSYSHILDFPTAQWLPNNSSPKITGDGPLELDLEAEVLPDVTTGTDMQLTALTAESNFTN
jgi:hypothetical protein